MISVGCCGLSFFPAKKLFGDNWRKEFKNHIQCYANKFDVLEINKTFYGIPREKTVERWLNDALEINNNFRFTLKAPREITHIYKFKPESIEYFSKFLNIVEALKSRIILFQTSKSFNLNKENKDSMTKFFARIRKEFDIDNIKLIWEPRGDALTNKSLKDFLKKNRLNECVDPLRNKKAYGKLNYFRLHGFGQKMMYNYEFSGEELERVYKLVRNTKQETYVLFNNFYKCEDALRFIKLLNTGHKPKKEI